MPVDGEQFDIERMVHYGEKGVLCMFSDSTNAEVPGFCPSEKTIYPSLEKHIAEAKERVILTTFASSVHRVTMILELAMKHEERSVC